MAVFGSIATGDIVNGAFYMALFGLGTLPMMTFVIYLKSFTQNIIKFNLKKLIPYAVAIIGILLYYAVWDWAFHMCHLSLRVQRLKLI